MRSSELRAFASLHARVDQPTERCERLHWAPLSHCGRFVFPVLVAATDLPRVLEAVGNLDQELERLTRHASALGASMTAHDQRTAASKLYKAITRATHAARSIRNSVLDSATELTIDRFESAFRARTIVIQIQLKVLAHVEPQIAHRLWPSPGRFTSVAEVGAFLLEGLGRASAQWRDGRRAIHADEGGAAHNLLLVAAASAERCVIELGRDTDLALFLAAGASLTCDEIRTPCREIVVFFVVFFASLARPTER